MKIGLIDIEPKIFNTALMQISFHHKNKGDTVEWAAPLEYDNYDVLYCSSLFDFTDKSQVPQRAICGGTGFDLTTKLDFDCEYDYSIYPKMEFSIVWFSRGCNRKCPFCVVPEKEGKIRSVMPKEIKPDSTYIIIQDNNFFASPEWEYAIWRIQTWGKKVSFDGGIDARILTVKHIKALKSIKHHKQIKIAWDNPKENLIPKLKKIIKHISHHKLMCFVLIGYWSTPEQDMHRVMTLRELGIDPFAMAYDKTDYYQRRFARWVNHKAIFMSVEWKDYK